MEHQEILLLHEALNRDILNTDVLKAINTMKKEKVLEIHPYNITPPATAGSRWMTYLKDEKGDRKKVTATDEAGIYKKLYNFYFVEQAATLKSLYPDWLVKRKNEGISARTVRRNENHWNKYYLNHKIINVPLNKLTSEQIEQFFYDTIRQFNITTKELGNMKFIFVDMMKMAKKKKLIDYNPFLDVEIKTNACKPQKKQNDRSRVYLPSEKEKLFKALNNEILKYPDVTDMFAVFLLFKLGLRIGELVALKWCDLDLVSNELHIHRMETLEEDHNGNLVTVIAEYTKKKSPYGDRFLPLGNYELEILEKVRAINAAYQYKDDDYIFCDSEGRTTIREIDNRIRKMCNHAGIEEKSAHDIRRTVASEMFNNGIPVEIIRNYLGHSDIKTTYSYILDNHEKEETTKMILLSLKNMDGFHVLKGTQSSENEKSSKPA